MSVTAIVVGLIVLVAIVAIAAWYFTQQRRRAELRQQFGPEYDHAVERYGEQCKRVRIETRAGFARRIEWSVGVD